MDSAGRPRITRPPQARQASPSIAVALRHTIVRSPAGPGSVTSVVEIAGSVGSNAQPPTSDPDPTMIARQVRRTMSRIDQPPIPGAWPLVAMCPFTFSAAVQRIHDAKDLSEVAHRAEAIGFTSLIVPDHMID